MSTKRSRAVDHLGFIRRTLSELSGYATLAFELIQNADDTKRATWLRFDVRDEALWVEDDGGFTDCGDQDVGPDDCLFLDEHGHRCDFHSFRLLSGADKRLRDDTTGAFGIGFTAVYQVTDRPEILSGVRHWTVDETAAEDDRITEERLDPKQNGTRIVLPWARDKNSEFRKRANAAAVPDGVKDTLLTALDEAVAPAMLFLRNLERVELALNGEVVREVTRTSEDGGVLIDDSGERHRWRLFEGSFQEAEADLRALHGELIESARKSIVAIAIPDGFDVEGRLCATLPTGCSSRMPIHVNAELYLSSDRRQPAMGTQHQADWNVAAIAACAELLADALHELPGLLGPERLWAALDSARAVARLDHPDAVGAALGAFWGHLEPRLPDEPLIWTTGEQWETIGRARFVQNNEDEPAFGLLHALGIALVHPALRSRQNILRAVGVDYLSVGDIVAVLDEAGLGDSVSVAQLPGPLDEPAARHQLWSQLGRMVGGARSDELRAAMRNELESAAVVPSTDGRLCPINAVWRTDRASVDLLSAVAPGIPFLDAGALPLAAKPLADLCDFLTAGAAVSELADARIAVEIPIARRLVAWFAQREADLTDDDREALAQLPIFPSSDGVHLLAEVALPGDFDDPLKLALLIDRATGREHGPFLDRLGVQRLSFETYACEQVPRAFEQDNLSVDQRRQVVSLLAQRRGQLEDVPRAQGTLSAVPLVEGEDDAWHLAADVYFDELSVRDVLGSRPLRARIPTDHALATQELLAWLGVAEDPRPADVIARAEEIARQPVTGPHRQIVARMVDWLGRRWVLLADSQRVDFVRLQGIRWLSARDSTAWHGPGQLDLAFRDYLYESQGLFLDVPRAIQQRAADMLRWLGLNETPTVEQVVAHLEHCASDDVQPNREVYGFLNDNSESDAISRLREIACLHIEGQWRRPDEVYWADHPFGGWRIRLGHEFSRYRELFSALGVNESPSVDDAISVIEDMSALFGRANETLADEDLFVLLACWRMCESALVGGELAEEAMSRLASRKAIADRRSVLMRPSLLYFEDLPGLADEMPGIKTHVIRRPDGAWRAMQAAGVEDLSKVAVARVVEIGDRVDHDVIMARLRDREEELARVITPRTSQAWRPMFETMTDLRVIEVLSMAIAWELDAFGQRFAGDPHDADALWQLQESSLFVVLSDGEPVWEAVARELVRALLPEVEPATLALDIAAALRPSTRAAAKQALDAAGFPSLATEIRADISTATATDLDADESEEYDPEGEPEPSTGSDAEDDSGLWDDDEDEEEEDAQDADQKDDGQEALDSASGGSGGGEATGGDEHSGAGEDGDSNAGAGTGGSSRGASSGAPRNRLRSYVVRDNGADQADSTEGIGERDEVDRAGVTAVVDYETQAGRVPAVQPHNNPGYDILSTFADEEIARYIEVKSSDGPWDQLGVGLSHTQFSQAQLVEDQYWLYVVEYARDEERRRIWPIPDPARQVTEFMFDDGWKDATDSA